ncbi:4-hydroxythreonine-4-phosphate dehydrogenase [Sulfurimonas sp. HSL-3221]|uniref:4-hydroxythreonine-4-phosphate dehydrogenase n=1 Tax=Sulfurimonadaceae TaxID=2771471 RepID=UPI001E3C4F1B|nr:4-hydroxythreonine-4-phosphate dehydrogenase [Sulfurimonas sp. HSL-3221]UFS63700.1 4-hydroxythreonine-4-phosphate dehydrogenase [Sulfurimonas sp. HSL-3221]
MSLPRLAVSIGDPNGVGPEIALRTHPQIADVCHPYYCVDPEVMAEAASLLGMQLPDDFNMVPLGLPVAIKPGCVTADAGRYSHASFVKAIALTEAGETDAIVTLPIHKEAWMQAGITYKGHTDLLRDHFEQEAIMMLGCNQLYVALFTEHVPLKEVPAKIERNALARFLVDLYRATGFDDMAVLGLNPHAGDNGVLGDEEREIEAAIALANDTIATKGFKCDGRPFFGPVVPDAAFTPTFRSVHRHIVAMYHDQGLAPLKALYFDESVNISLNLPIVRTSVDHGTAFDIAYRGKARLNSYRNAVDTALRLL